MPRLGSKLTELEIRRAKPKDKPYKMYDEEGLLLLVRPSGTKVWQYPYKIGGKYNIYTIGRYNPDEGKDGLRFARAKRDEIRKLLSEGIDPNIKKKQSKIDIDEKYQNSFKNIALEWFNKQSWTEKHRKNISNRLDKDVFPIIGNMPIEEISARNIISILNKIEERGALDVAKRVNQYCSNIFEYAIIQDIQRVGFLTKK